MNFLLTLNRKSGILTLYGIKSTVSNPPLKDEQGNIKSRMTSLEWGSDSAHAVFVIAGKDLKEDLHASLKESLGREPTAQELRDAFENEITRNDKEVWIGGKKAEEAGCLFGPNAYEYGMLLIEERGDTERGKRYLDKAAENGY